MNRKQLIAFAKRMGWKGATLDSLKAWAVENGYDAFDLGNDIVVEVKDFEKVWGKGVTIRLPEGVSVEDLIVEDDSNMDEDEDAEAKAEEDDEDEAAEKAAKQRARKKSFRDEQAKVTGARRAGARKSGRIGDKVSAAKFAYDNAVKKGLRIRGTNAVPVFKDADTAELTGSLLRLGINGRKYYNQRSQDEEIVEKSGSTFNPGTGGALVAGEYAPELIELFDQYGVARQAVGVTSMREGTKEMPRLHTDVTVYDGSESGTMTASDFGTDLVTLNATKSYAYSTIPSELMEDAAISVADIVARSSARAIGKWEDESFFLGSHNRTGVTDLLGTIGTDQFDSASGAWSAITISDIQSAIGLLPGWALAEGISIVCSSAFYSTVLDTFAMGAGGNTGADLKSGFPGQTMWGRYPVHISEVMPSSYSDGQNVMLIGAFGASSKFGIVDGSEAFESSEHVGFASDSIAFRYKQRWAMNLHDVGGSGSGVVSLLA